MKLYLFLYLAINLITLSLSSCASPEISQQQPRVNRSIVNDSQKEITLDKNFKAVMSQVVSVPVYSYIYHNNQKKIFNLAVTLSIRNTDMTETIIISSVRYFGSDGKLVKHYLERPIQLDAMASIDFFVDRNDNSGGLGANFIVEWVAETEVFEPVIEAVMVGTDFQQGISWVSSGKVLKSDFKRSSSKI